MANLADHLFRQARERGDKVALVFGAQSWTFAEMAELVLPNRADLTFVTDPSATYFGTPVGTDSLASAPDLNLFAELAELRRLAPEAPARRLLAAATVGGAEALGLAADFGAIEAGRRAELVVVDTAGVADPEEAVLRGLDATRVRPWRPSGNAGVH